MSTSEAEVTIADAPGAHRFEARIQGELWVNCSDPCGDGQQKRIAASAPPMPSPGVPPPGGDVVADGQQGGVLDELPQGVHRNLLSALVEQAVREVAADHWFLGVGGG